MIRQLDGDGGGDQVDMENEVRDAAMRLTSNDTDFIAVVAPENGTVVVTIFLLILIPMKALIKNIHY